MNKISYFLIPLVLVLMSFSECGDKKFDKKPPFDLVESSYQDWTGGQPGVRGLLVTLKIEKPQMTIAFDSIHFRNKVVKIKLSEYPNYIHIVGNFVDSRSDQRDLILSSDPSEEFGNTPPQKNPSSSLRIPDNDAIISYIIDGRKRYFILENIKKGDPIFYK